MRPDYDAAVRAFSLHALEATLHGTLDALNACTECCGRHPPDALALRWSDAGGGAGTLTFGALLDRAGRVANLLASLGVRPGDVVAGLLPRTPDLLAVALGTWRAGAVYQPLFTAFGPRAVAQRLQTSGARVAVTDAANRAKLDEAPGLGHVLLAGPELDAALAAQPAAFDPVPRTGDDPFLLMSTSGTTGLPKGVQVPLRALLSFGAYMRQSVDLQPADRFWNLADPGWAYGMYYAVVGPLLLGQATTFHDGPFTAASAVGVMRRQGITNLAGAPTAFRLLIADGGLAALRGQLRVISSAGEPLNPEVIRWVQTHLGIPIMDHYGQTELGMVVCNHHGLRHAVRAGSAGVPLPGYRVAVLDDADAELPPGVPGVLAVDIARSPLLWFRGYLGQPPLAAGYYRTGDTVEWERGRGRRHQLRRARGRHHHVRRLPHRPVRGRKRPGGASRRDGGRRRGPPRPRAHGGRRGLCRADAGHGGDARAGGGAAAARPHPPVRPRLPAGGPLRPGPAQDAQRQAATLRAARAGAGGGLRPGRGRDAE